jgi:hypothetical protein
MNLRDFLVFLLDGAYWHPLALPLAFFLTSLFLLPSVSFHQVFLFLCQGSSFIFFGIEI